MNCRPGDLFLDEIGEMPLDLQVSVAISGEGNIMRLEGGGVTVDVRVIAASNKNLKDEVMKGIFVWIFIIS